LAFGAGAAAVTPAVGPSGAALDVDLDSSTVGIPRESAAGAGEAACLGNEAGALAGPQATSTVKKRTATHHARRTGLLRQRCLFITMPCHRALYRLLNVTGTQVTVETPGDPPFQRGRTGPLSQRRIGGI